MVRIIGCITQQHDIRLVILAGILCAVGSFTTMSVLGRATAGPGRTLHVRWLVAAGIVGGAAVWTTHFVAMLAYRPGTVFGYDIGLTVLSIVIAVAFTGGAFAVALWLDRPELGGALFGLAISMMHFTGIAALSAAASFRWDFTYVGAAIALSVVLGAATLAACGRGRTLPRRAAGAALMTLAIVTMHFTAMTALTIEPDPFAPVELGAIVPPDWLVVAVTAAMVTIVAFGLWGSIIDDRLAQRATQEAERLRRHVEELQRTQRELETRTVELDAALRAAAAASEAKSVFLATMSHELRTPLNAIIGFSEMLGQEMFGRHSDPRYKEYAESVCESGQHLLGLINDVLDFSKIDAGRLELNEGMVDLGKAIRGAAHMVSGQAATTGVALDLDLLPELPLVRGDERRVRQVVLNLLSNAVKFTPADGRVRLTCEARPNGTVAIVVADTGIGIAAKDIPRALDRFGQIDSSLARRYDGTGLGLPLAKKLMELHGGTLKIESEVGVGTTVTVVFPPSRVVAGLVAA